MDGFNTWMCIHSFIGERANGWAIMSMIELLNVISANHLGYQEVLNQLREHIDGLITYQTGTGFGINC